MKKRSIILLTLIWPCLLVGQIQNGITLAGTVTEGKGGVRVPYVNILVKGSRLGTVSNELGGFELKVRKLPVSLVVSHVGYKRQEIEVAEEGGEIAISLEVAELLGVEVVAKKTDKIYQLINKAMQRTKEQMEQDQYGRAFYRQISKNDSIYSELYEIFYDTKFSANGISDWAIQQGRYALQENNEGRGLVFNKNFTLLDRIFPTLDPGLDMFHTPVSGRVEDFYRLQTEKIIQQEEQEIAVVLFTPKSDIVGKTPSMEGRLYIDLKTFDILKLSGRFDSNELKVIAFRGKGKVDNYVLEYESAFQQGENGELLLDYISAKQDFDVVYDDRPTKKVSTQSLLNVYEYYSPGKRNQRLGGRLNFKKSDARAIDQKGYDREFWTENAIVKRTPVEEEVIADFERNRQFGSIFLNNRNQVSFIPDIDQDHFIQTLFEKMKINVPIQEKIYLHLDKPYYASGETIWYKAYVLDASFHRSLNASKAIWVDLVDPHGQILIQQLLPVQGEGVAFGELKCKKQWPAGRYQLRAYTDRMKFFDPNFFFQHELELVGMNRLVENKTPDFDVQFFPEGGDLVTGLSSQLAFLAIDEEGRGIPVEGKIVDDQGKEIRRINTSIDGRNSIIFQPALGRSYKAEVQYGKRSKQFKIPEALGEGYVMSVRNKKGKNLSIRVLSSAAKVDTEVYLVGQVRGKVYYKSKGTLANQLLNFEIPRQLFPSGILQLSLMDKEGRVYAERLCFVDQEDTLQLQVNLTKKNFGPRDEIVLKMVAKDVQGRPVQGNFSLAITDSGQLLIPVAARDIRSYVWLESDLKGRIEAPNRYFDPTNPKAERMLDLLMLTNAWRRFSWQDVLKGDVVEAPFFAQGFEVCGSLRVEDVNKYKEAELALVTVGPTGGFYTTQVDELGRFCFYDVNFVDTTFLSVQAISQNGQTSNLEVIFDAPKPPKSNYRATSNQTELGTAGKKVRENYTSIMKARQEEASILNGDFVLLDEVVVTGNKITRQPAQSLHETEFADVVLQMDEQYQNHPNVLSVMEGKVPGMQVLDDGYRSIIRITGGTNDPLVLFDGMPVNSLNWTLPDLITQAGTPGGGGQGNNEIGDSGTRMATAPAATSEDKELYNFLRTLSPRTVDRIEVLKGGNAAMYGVRGANGVIAIYSKSGAYDPGERVNGNAYPGYYTAREFYAPKYNGTDAGLLRKDRRSTIYWNPNIQTDQSGKAEVRFFNTDIAKQITIELEGTDSRGQFGSLRLKMETNK